jgi:1,4-dihydroxy-2-naphthoate octaprenyltransferase
MLSLILLVFALVLFLIAAASNPPEPWRWRFGWLGLACFIGAILFKAGPWLLKG